MADSSDVTLLEWLANGASYLVNPGAYLFKQAASIIDDTWKNMQNGGGTESQVTYKSYLEDMGNLLYENVDLGNVGIFGIPYQFNKDADVPLGQVASGKGYAKYIGRTYEERILSNCPVVYFRMGKPDFLGGKDNGVGTVLLNTLLSGTENVLGEGGELEFTGNELSKLEYYTFADCFDEYAAYVNTMARFVAIKMGLGDKIYPNQKGNDKYSAFDIKQIRNRLLGSEYENYDHWQFNIPLYCNVEATSVSESAANTVGDSMLASTLQQGSQLAREVNFLLGTDKLEGLTDLTSTLAGAVESIVGGVTSGNVNGFLKNINNGVTSVVSGANLLFPAIWQDSSFSKSYSISARFTTPYGDPESIFLDVYVPYLCLLAMALPRQSTASAYTSPFLIRAHSKGYFNCDLGMVESMEIKRGGQSGQEWTIDGFPTEIEVTMSLRDLYPTIVMTKARATGFMFSSNNGITQYLNMMAGVNLCAINPFANILAGFKMLDSTYRNIDNLIDMAENKIVRFGYNTIQAVFNKFF